MAAAALLVGALVVAVRVRDDPPSPAAGAPVGGLEDPRSVVSALARGRARALGTLSEPALGAVDAPGSAALAADTAFLGRLRRARLRLSGLGFEVTDAGVLEVGGETAVVRARVTTSAYVQVRADGSIALRVPAGTARSVRLTLVRTPAGWRLAAAG